jgi:hypothetical protein
METPTGEGSGFWDFLIYVYENDGIWVLLFLGLAYVFYRLIWKVWSAAMTRMQDEIERISNERDFYQRKVFPDLLTSDPKRLLDENGKENGR